MVEKARDALAGERVASAAFGAAGVIGAAGTRVCRRTVAATRVVVVGGGVTARVAVRRGLEGFRIAAASGEQGECDKGSD